MNCSGSEVPFGNLLPIGFGELCESTEDESVSPGCHAIDVNDLLVPSRFTSSFKADPMAGVDGLGADNAVAAAS